MALCGTGIGFCVLGRVAAVDTPLAGPAVWDAAAIPAGAIVATSPAITVIATQLRTSRALRLNDRCPTAGVQKDRPP